MSVDGRTSCSPSDSTRNHGNWRKGVVGNIRQSELQRNIIFEKKKLGDIEEKKEDRERLSQG